MPDINWASDYEEIIQRHSRNLGRDKNRVAVFEKIYGRHRRPWTYKTLLVELGVSEEDGQVIRNALNKLAGAGLIKKEARKPTKEDPSRSQFSKLEAVSAHKVKILDWAKNPEKANQVVTLSLIHI